MIINCDNCNKKFSLKDSLIPINGRLLECGYCKNRWFFKPNDNLTKEVISSNNNTTNIENISKNEKISSILINQSDSDKNLSNTNISKDSASNKLNNLSEFNKKKKNKQSLKNYLNNSLIILITFCTIIIIVDTFKKPISNFLPGIIPLLENLYASMTDLLLFIKDLFN